jgi:hypothetical protein
MRGTGQIKVRFLADFGPIVRETSGKSQAL